jgi:hypothetical protein
MNQIDATMSKWRSIFDQLGQTRALLDEALANGSRLGVIEVLRADLADLDRASAEALKDIQSVRLVAGPIQR